MGKSPIKHLSLLTERASGRFSSIRSRFWLQQ